MSSLLAAVLLLSSSAWGQCNTHEFVEQYSLTGLNSIEISTEFADTCWLRVVPSQSLRPDEFHVRYTAQGDGLTLAQAQALISTTTAADKFTLTVGDGSADPDLPCTVGTPIGGSTSSNGTVDTGGSGGNTGASTGSTGIPSSAPNPAFSKSLIACLLSVSLAWKFAGARRAQVVVCVLVAFTAQLVYAQCTNTTVEVIVYIPSTKGFTSRFVDNKVVVDLGICSDYDNDETACGQQSDCMWCEDTITCQDQAAQCKVWYIDAYAGTGVAGVANNGASRTVAQLQQSIGLQAIDGFLYIADTFNHRIRRVDMYDDSLTTIAGDGTESFNCDDCLAIDSYVNLPHGVEATPDNKFVYIADTKNHRIRQIDVATGIITTIAGTGVECSTACANSCTPECPAAACTPNCGVTEDPVAGTSSTLAVNAQLSEPHGMIVVQDVEMYIVDTRGQRVWHVDLTTGLIKTLIGTGTAVSCEQSCTEGDSACVDACRSLPGYQMSIAQVGGMGLDPYVGAYIADRYNQYIRLVDLTSSTPYQASTVAGNGEFYPVRGNPGTYSGDNGPALGAGMDHPNDCWLDHTRTILYIGEVSPEDPNLDPNVEGANKRVRRVNLKTGQIDTFAGTGVMCPAGEGCCCGSRVPIADFRFHDPWGVKLGADRAIYIADRYSQKIHRIWLDEPGLPPRE